MREQKQGDLGVPEFIRMFKSLLIGGKAVDGKHVGGKSVKKTPGDAAAKWISNPWHAVSILVSESACPAARKAATTRFLSDEAPVLPLAGCTARSCTCRYRHHQDRRQRPRRRADISGAMARWPGVERRGRGRRAAD
jgi:hypothetical protein